MTWRMTRDFCTFDMASVAPVVTAVVQERARCVSRLQHTAWLSAWGLLCVN